jgi:hypothetical protein
MGNLTVSPSRHTTNSNLLSVPAYSASRVGSIAQMFVGGPNQADLTDALNHLQVIGISECGWRNKSILREHGGKLLATDAPYVAYLRAELGRLNDAEITQVEKKLNEFSNKKTTKAALDMAARGGDDYVQAARGAIQRRNANVERLLEKLVRAVTKREEAYQNNQPQHVIKKEEQAVNRVLLEIRNLASTYSSRRVQPQEPGGAEIFAIMAL